MSRASVRIKNIKYITTNKTMYFVINFTFLVEEKIIRQTFQVVRGGADWALHYNTLILLQHTIPAMALSLSHRTLFSSF